MWNAGLDDSQAGIKIVGRSITTSDMQMITLLVETEEELKSILMRVKEETGKNWLKPQHSKN